MMYSEKKKQRKKTDWLKKERKKIDELKKRKKEKSNNENWWITRSNSHLLLTSIEISHLNPEDQLGLAGLFLSSHWLCCRSRESFWHDQALSAFILVHLISLPENNAGNRSANGRSLTYCHWIFIGLPILLRNIIKRSTGLF